MGKSKKATTDAPYEPVSVAQEDLKKYDLVLFGATGFTGKMAAVYIAKNYGGSKSFNWAIAGRRKGALEEIRKVRIIIKYLTNIFIFPFDG